MKKMVNRYRSRATDPLTGKEHKGTGKHAQDVMNGEDVSELIDKIRHINKIEQDPLLDSISDIIRYISF